MKPVLKATLIISLIRLLDMFTTYISLNKFGIIFEGNKLIVLQFELFNNLFLALLCHYILTVILTYYILKLINYLNDNKKFKKPNLFKLAKNYLIIIFSIVPVWNLINILFG